MYELFDYYQLKVKKVEFKCFFSKTLIQKYHSKNISHNIIININKLFKIAIFPIHSRKN